ncbi:MAG: GyrI-like domain-containing protein [Alphaproteobacteria bacterium]
MEASNAALSPRFVDGKAMRIVGIRQTHVGSNAGIPAQWLRFAPHIGRVPGEVDGAAYGVCIDRCSGDGQSFDYIAGVEVASTAAAPEGLSPLSLPARRYAVFHHPGHVSSLPDTIEAIWRTWLPGSGEQPAGEPAFLERYGEAFDPLTGAGGMEIWVPLMR